MYVVVVVVAVADADADADGLCRAQLRQHGDDTLEEDTRLDQVLRRDRPKGLQRVEDGSAFERRATGNRVEARRVATSLARTLRDVEGTDSAARRS